MAFWSKKKPHSAPFQTHTLPGNVGTVSLPSFLTVEVENDDTLTAYRDESITLRFSSISFAKPGQSDEETAKDYVHRQAKEMNHPYSESGENGIMSFEEQTEEEGEPLVISYWYVGAKNTILIVSATVLATQTKSPSVREILDLMPQVIESVKITLLHKRIVHEDQEIPVTEQVVESTEQQIASFGPAENAWLEECRSVAASLGLKYGSGGDLTPDELDLVFSRWTFDDDDKESSDSVADALGVAFGDYLVENHEFRWVIVTDEYGTANAVRHRDSEVMTFPTSSVAKRIEDNEPECFKILLAMLLDVLGRFKNDES